MMDLSSLKRFDVAALMSDATGKPLSLPLARIELDPDNVRTKVDPAALAELVESIRTQGLIQPISVRPHPAKRGHYLVNAGERRLRAHRELGRDTIEAFVREQFDPYLQAVENIQREALSAMDLARFVAKREAEGETRAAIARKLGKSASFVTEAAKLAEAPPEIIAALDAGRIPDTRSAYLLTKAWGDQAPSVRRLLDEPAPMTRESIRSALDPTSPVRRVTSTPTQGLVGRATPPSATAWDALAVEVEGRAGRMALSASPSPALAWVHFEDGTREVVDITLLRLRGWTMLEGVPSTT